MIRGNSKIMVLGERTRFGTERALDPSVAARKKNQQAHTASLRLALRRLACADFDIDQPLTLDLLIEKFGRNGTKISGVQMLAARKFLLALKGDVRLMQQVTDDIDGKQVQGVVEAKTTLADLVNASVTLERRQPDADTMHRPRDD